MFPTQSSPYGICDGISDIATIFFSVDFEAAMLIIISPMLYVCGRGVLLTTHPLLVPRSWKGRANLYPPSGPHQACDGITLPSLYQCLMCSCTHLLIYHRCCVYVMRSLTALINEAQNAFYWIHQTCINHWLLLCGTSHFSYPLIKFHP